MILRSVELNGVRLSNDGLVDIDDISDGNIVSIGDHALNCVTNLVACCNFALPGVSAPIYRSLVLSRWN